MTIKEDKMLVVVCVVLLILSAGVFAFLKSGEEEAKEETTAPAAVLDATRASMGSGKSTMITAQALYANLNDGFSGNDPFILSVRTAEQYATGHIPGAVNIPWRSVFTEENILKLPTNKQIVVVCYTGHTASQITALLNINGYDAVCLKWGMTAWTSNATVAPGHYDKSTIGNYPVSVGSTPGTLASATTVEAWLAQDIRCGGDAPEPAEEPVETSGDTEDLRPLTNSYLLSGKPPVILGEALYNNLNDGNANNDPFVLSIRSATQYAVGHIPGSINVAFTRVFTDENLSKLPDDDQQIVVVCYTGHTASQTAALLNVNGYNATALKWGMTGWTTNATVSPSGYNRATDCQNYPVILGNASGTIADGVIADIGEVVHTATNDLLGAGKVTMITAEALYNNLNDNYASNDPFILSVRSEEQYATGHIPGAMNIPWRSVFTEENISKLPTNKEIVVVCYTGHTASQVTAMLNVLGFDALCLKWGMCSWTSNTTVAPSCFDPANDAYDYPVISGSDAGSWTGTRTRQGCGDDTGGGDGGTVEAVTGSVFDITRGVCNNYLSMGKSPAIAADALYEQLNDGNASNDPFLLSIRSADQYAIGHIPGAVNIGMSSLFSAEHLAKLPTDRQIVVICYTGHTASQATALLNINGYDAIALKHGMTSWSTNGTVAPAAYDRGTDAHNYPVSVGTDAGELGTATVVGVTEAEVLRRAALSYLEGGAKFISANDLHTLLNDSVATNDPFILSIRSATHYTLGHIPGAVNFPWRGLFSVENLSLLPADDTQIVVVCYTGQSASQITALLNILGFNASTLAHGMCAWTANTTIAPYCFDNTTHQHAYPVCNGSEPGRVTTATRQGCGDDTGGQNAGAYASTSDEWELLRRAAEQYVNEVVAMTITAEALYNNLWDGYSANDPFIISIRSTDDYEAGHLPGAVNIPSADLFSEEMLALLPEDPDQQIVVYCYTGHSAGHVTALLNINGYDTISLKFGMCSWSDDTTVNANKCYDSATKAHNFPLSTGGAAGDWATATPMA